MNKYIYSFYPAGECQNPPASVSMAIVMGNYLLKWSLPGVNSSNFKKAFPTQGRIIIPGPAFGTTEHKSILVLPAWHKHIGMESEHPDSNPHVPLNNCETLHRPHFSLAPHL